MVTFCSHKRIMGEGSTNQSVPTFALFKEGIGSRKSIPPATEYSKGIGTSALHCELNEFIEDYTPLGRRNNFESSSGASAL